MPLAAVVAIMVVSGCNATGGRPANDPRYVAAIRDYYDRMGAEPAPGCDAPRLVVFRDLQVLQSYGQVETLRMFARFDYEQRDAATQTVLCNGVGERYFTVFKTTKGPKVLGMSGRKREAA